MTATATRRRRSSAEWQRIATVWLAQHAQACVFSAGQMFRNPVGSLLTSAVIGISLALPAGFYLVLANVQQVTAGWGGTARISLFLEMDVAEERGRALAAELATRPAIEDVQYISREEALAEYQRMSGFAEAIAGLPENPLPAVILVQPSSGGLEGDAGDRLIAELRAIPEVDTGQFDRQWVQRLFALLDILKRAVLVLAAVLAIGVLLIIGNTIRLAILNRREEIEINKLFGATNGFIRRPFLYAGLLHGVLGAVLAWLLVSVSLELMAGPVARLADLYGSGFRLTGLGPREVLYLAAGGGLLGLVGSWLAVHRHLREVGPL
ncbi:MAG TPA: permease-like cell division protein FtsX [Gammaproteobacteria bacterium]|jgi:cell division transport system permease protein